MSWPEPKKLPERQEEKPASMDLGGRQIPIPQHSELSGSQGRERSNSTVVRGRS